MCAAMPCVALCKLSDVDQSLLISLTRIEENDNIFQREGIVQQDEERIAVWAFDPHVLVSLVFPIIQYRTTLECVSSWVECRVSISIFFVVISSLNVNFRRQPSQIRTTFLSRSLLASD